MAQQITTWRPDTCDCVIHYSWDDEVSLEERVHVLSSIQKCAIHQGLTDQDAFDGVMSENQNKNNALGIIHENYPALVDVSENGAVSLKPEYEYIWSFDENRKLQIELKGVDKTTAESIDSTLKAELGEDAVAVKL